MPNRLHISVSQIKTYLRCPRQYELRYLLGIPPAFVPVALAFGSAFHAALAHYYQALKDIGQAPSLDELNRSFEGAWSTACAGPMPLQEDGSSIDHVAKGISMLAAFYRDASSPRAAEVEAVELAFAVALHDPDSGAQLEEQLAGVFDLVLVEEDRRCIVEHKTAARRWSASQLRYDLQATAYKLAARELGLGDADVRFQIITKGSPPAVQVEPAERHEQDFDDLCRVAVGILRAVDAKAFYPLRGTHCQTCPVAHACEASERRPR